MVPIAIVLLDCIYWLIHQLFLGLQASELRAYIKAKGADISEENSEGGLRVRPQHRYQAHLKMIILKE